MVVLDDFEDLKRRVAKLQRENDRATGAYEQVRAQIQEKYGCRTLSEARELLADMRAEELKLGKRYTKAKQKLEEEFADVFNGNLPEED